MDQMMKYLEDGELPSDKKEALKLSLKVTRFVIQDIKLYKRGWGLLISGGDCGCTRDVQPKR